MSLKQKRIGVLFGGVSSEREISLRSGKNVCTALESLGYKVIPVDIVSRDCTEQLREAKIDVAYVILHGVFGEDGDIQQILEDLKIPYTGSGVTSSAQCMDKLSCKTLLLKAGLPVPGFTRAAPAVVKAPCEGSSIGVTIVHTQDELEKAYRDTAQKFGPGVFIEEFISGAEVTVGVLEDAGKTVALPILELRPKNEFYDFESKYTPGGTEFILPAELSPVVTKHVQDLAVKAYQALHCAGAVRVDFVVRERRTPFILEINTLPGMTDQSDLPAEAKALGIAFPQLVEKILKTAACEKR
jgi:D-alanine-D-alanine ligase